uniref:Ymf39 n=1 Tax=Madagascaria erythrocladioides TaxID=753684 RepID=UPI001FCCD447|nr:Ymf39 [Madagascaria erythrocladioides]UNJ18786.1 Ymf39 [Madagascaria erythrocladioides]
MLLSSILNFFKIFSTQSLIELDLLKRIFLFFFRLFLIGLLYVFFFIFLEGNLRPTEEFYILISFISFYIYISFTLTPQISQLLTSQISKVEITLNDNLSGIHKDLILLKQKLKNFFVVSQIKNLHFTTFSLIQETFKHTVFNLIYNAKLKLILNLKVIKLLEKQAYKLLYLYSYVELHKFLLVKQRYTNILSTSSLKQKLNTENSELLFKI